MNYKNYQDYVNKAYVEYRNQNVSGALENLLEAEKIFADEDLLIDIALLYDEINNYDLATDYYHKVLDKDITDARAYYGLGVLYDNQKRFDEAKAYYKEAINYDDDYFEAHFFIANIYDDEKETNLAIYHYKRVIEINPEYFYGYLNLGAIYENLNENEIALDYLLKAQAINDDNHLLHFNLGVVYRKLKQVGSSIESYLRSLTISNSHPFTFLNLAIIYKDDLKDITKAIDTYTLGIKEHPNVAVLYYNRGCAYSLIKAYDKAIDDLVEAISLDPKLKEYMFEDDELIELMKLPQFLKNFHNN
ncbi:MAG: hypothetical protein K0Q49_770 [Haloplasmataceae bacterium]|jgi:tetratricopeptide (TPR) repeat protein|nr:hypothetical protein [Haloplasmataceae bacterium]